MSAEVKREIQSKLEGELMEIEALEAHLTKSHSLSKQAVQLMDSIDSRLLRLETTILPIHGSTQKLSKVYENMENALGELDIVMQYIDAANLELATLSTSPSNPGDLDAYFASIDRLREAYSFITVTAKLSNAEDVKSAQLGLLAKSTQNLDNLLRKWLSDLSSTSKSQTDIIVKLSQLKHADPKEACVTLPKDLFPPTVMDDLSKLINYLAAYENDSNVHGTLAPNTNFAKTVVEVRSKYLADIFSNIIRPDDEKRVFDLVGPYTKGSGLFLPYLRTLLYAFNLEWSFQLKIIPANISSTITLSRSSKMNIFKSVFESIISPAATNFYTISQALLVKIRRNIVQGHEFTAGLLVLDILNMVYLQYGDQIKYQLDNLKNLGKKIIVVRGSVNELTALSFKTFTEFLDEIRHSSSKNSLLPEDGTVHEISSNTVGFLKKFSEYLDICELLLRVLQNLPRWEEFLEPQSGNVEADDLAAKVWQASLQVGEASDKESLEQKYVSLHKYCVESVDCLMSNLETKAKAYKKGMTGEKSSKSTLASVFMLNNYHFISKSLRANGDILKVVGKEIEKKLSDRIQEEMDAYMECWKPLLAGLMDPSGAKLMKTQLSKNERNTVKDIFKNFNDEFDEQFKLQKRFSIPDVDLRNQIIKNIKQLLVPMYTRVYERYKEVDFTKNPEKYLKYDVGSLEAAIERFFDVGA